MIYIGTIFTHCSACDVGCLYHSDDPFEPSNSKEGFPRLCVVAPGTRVEILLRLFVSKINKIELSGIFVKDCLQLYLRLSHSKLVVP